MRISALTASRLNSIDHTASKLTVGNLYVNLKLRKRATQIDAQVRAPGEDRETRWRQDEAGERGVFGEALPPGLELIG
jgi:hypothetical protein